MEKKFLKKGLQLGDKTLPNNIFYSPLAGCSDFPFRKMSAKFGPGLMFCEMTKMEGLVRNERSIMRMLDYDPTMRPIGAQLCGSNLSIAGKAARMVEELGFDVVDFNCGCPVDKVTKDGSGSGMLRTPHLIGEMITNMVAAVKIPVTVKIRAGWDENSINAEEIVRIAEKAGAKSICIHGRTRKQGYTGPANWDWIRDAKKAATTILVIGNGDLFDAEAAQKMFEYTGCDGIMVSRGTMGQPWIVEDMMRHLEGLAPIDRSFAYSRQSLIEHFEHSCQYHDERRVILDMRRVGCWYVTKSSGSRAFRGYISKANGLEEVKELIYRFPFHEEEAPHGRAD